MLNGVPFNGTILTTTASPSATATLYTFVEGDFAFGELDVQANNGVSMWAWRYLFTAKKDDADAPVIVGTPASLYSDGDNLDGWTATISIASGNLILAVSGSEEDIEWVYTGRLKIQQPDVGPEL
jgi:hypothetical protein